MHILKGDKLLSKTQCQVLRGIAIAGIFLHNFCHLLRGSNEENEFEFIAERAQNMWHYWTGGNIDAFFPIQFLAFFGHYGVPVFLFLSGYGLVMKYERGEASSRIEVGSFIGHHWLKLFRLMFLGFVLTIVAYLSCGLKWHGWDEYIAQATLLSNILPDLADSHTPSPYWFFGMMFEVYVVYRLLIYPFHDKRRSPWRWLMPVLLAVLAWLPQVFMEHHHKMLIYVRHNALIAMLPFALGIVAARYGIPKLPRWLLGVIAVVSLPLLALVSLKYQLWLWAPLLVLAGIIAFVKFLEPSRGMCGSVVMKPLYHMGALSSMIFVVHSIVNRPLYELVLKHHSNLMLVDYAWLTFYIAATLALAWGYKQYISFISKWTS